MSINHALLGLLSCQPLAGYDLKKMIQKSSFMHWSGNNNQIYKALLALRDEGFVTSEVCHQDGSPSKKIYSITPDGMAELKRWTMTSPESPEIKRSFLIQLAWTEALSQSELDHLLDEYESEIKTQILLEQGQRKKGYFSPQRSPRESAIWDSIYDGIVDAYENELIWLDNLRKKLAELNLSDDPNSCLIHKDTGSYLSLPPSGKLILTEHDGLDLISLCAERGTRSLMIHGERLPDDFFVLKTGLAGAILQKLTIYGIKTAVILTEERLNERFSEFAHESNQGRVFGVFDNPEDAEAWLLQ